MADSYTSGFIEMIRYLYLAKSLKKRLESIRCSGKKGRIAADNCDYILRLMRKQNNAIPELQSKRTKHGEGRICNCIKYNLGNGYRLVTVLSGERLFIPFIGTHDETDVWLGRHRNSTFSKESGLFSREDLTGEKSGFKGSKHTHFLSEGESAERDLYEEAISARIDEATLKFIFRGLYQNSDQSSERSLPTVKSAQ